MPSSCVSWPPRSTRGTPTSYPLVCQCRKSALTVKGDVWSGLPAQVRVFVGQELTAAGSPWLAYFACTVAQRSQTGPSTSRYDPLPKNWGCMKKLFLGSVALVALGLGAPAAFAAEMRVPAYTPPPPPAPVNTWSGCYAGGVAGTSWGRSNRTAVLNTAVPQGAGLPITNDFDLSGFTGGFDVGCNWQLGTWVFGVEGDWSADNKAGQAPRSPSSSRDAWRSSLPRP